jgi:branched-chain amino acid transport system ATP-binding protein
MTLLETRELRKSFGGLVAVDGVSFTVELGQIKALIGPNGAGKTTLFNLVTGLIPPDRGTVRFKGKDLTGRKPYQVARAGVSRTFQNPSLFGRMNVLENVMVGRHSRSRSEFWGCALRLPGQRREEAQIRETAFQELSFVGLCPLALFPAAALTFGQRRMAELARALATGPEMLLLDEPASGLNTSEKRELADLIRRIRQRGITVLLVEHDMSMVMRLSDAVVVLHNGAKIAEGTPAEIQNNEEVVRVYLGGDTLPSTDARRS